MEKHGCGSFLPLSLTERGSVHYSAPVNVLQLSDDIPTSQYGYLSVTILLSSSARSRPNRGLDSGMIWIVTEESAIPRAVLFREGEGSSPRSASKRLLKEPNGISHTILGPDEFSHGCCPLAHRLVRHHRGDGPRQSLRVHLRVLKRLRTKATLPNLSPPRRIDRR